jgi:predicted DNA-binding transcriptional regulator AlpA
MTAETILQGIETLVEAKVRQLLESDRLWSYAQIATYIGIDEVTVRDRISKQPSFPQAIRIKYDGKLMRPRYEPKDVKNWALGFKEKRAA